MLLLFFELFQLHRILLYCILFNVMEYLFTAYIAIGLVFSNYMIIPKHFKCCYSLDI